jgi:hypothetical protein
LNSEANQQFQVEEKYQFKGFGKFYNLFEIFSISSLKNLRSTLIQFNQRRPIVDVSRCDEQTFERNSNVSEPCPAAETKIKSNPLNDRQRQVAESTPCLVYDITCLGSEIDPQFSVEEYAVLKRRFIDDF